MSKASANGQVAMWLAAAMLFSCNLGCARGTKKIASGGKAMQLIDYANIRDGILYHGTISDLDGPIRATWTYDKDGRRVDRDQKIDKETFDALCNGVKRLQVFKKNRVRDPNKRIDPSKFNVVRYISSENGNQTQNTFLIPIGENDDDFGRWLRALSVPDGQ